MLELGFYEFSNGNALIKEWLRSKKRNNLSLETADGFFVCPDDYSNRASKLPKVILEISTIEILRDGCPGIFPGLGLFKGMFRDYDRLDYYKFKNDAKLGYLFSVAAYLSGLPSGEYSSFKLFYSKDLADRIMKDFCVYLERFARLARDARIMQSRKHYFDFARWIILKKLGKDYEMDLRSMDIFIQAISCNVFSHVLGDGFEDYCAERVYNHAYCQVPEIQSKLAKVTGEEGVIIKFEKSKVFKEYAQIFQGRSVPDLIYVTSSRIYPIDMKATLYYADPVQISRSNLRALMASTKIAMDILFSGILVDGTVYL